MSTGPVSRGPKLVNSCSSHFTQKWFHLRCWISDENFAHVPPSPHIRMPFCILIFSFFFSFFLFCFVTDYTHYTHTVMSLVIFCIVYYL